MKTVDEILREMRKMGENYSKSESNDCRYVAYWLGTTFADRIEAAAKALEADRDNWRRQALDEDARANATHKDSLAVGDMAAMFNALENSNGLLEELALIGEWSESARGQIAENKAALAAPARNCDVYETESERQSAFINWYNETFDLKGSKYAIDTCDLKHNIDDILHEYIEWLFAEAKGESK